MTLTSVPSVHRRWFTTSAFTRLRHEEGETVRVPTSVAHAKEAGTPWTACGVRAGTWSRMWHVEFPPEKVESCRLCLRIVAASGR